MAEGYHRFMDKILDYAPNSTQVLGAAALVTTGAILLFFTGLATLVLAPVLILLSPVLIPAGALLFVTVAGIFSAGCFALAAFLGVSWFYNYLNGRHPPGSDQVDYARMRIAHTASHVKDYAKGYGGYLQGKRQDAAPGA
ncbi:hypothetical protein SUGI_0694250 [Cryptomeria japonica]|uniref:oleosin n=1 Tax=Cryptomeria japonica TaxID=3369 RepID=UPI002414CDE0|nr:oleosin [Cryptomeria japonica]GLJ34524.1 hypothetical protein SUGI_0694250 [Cryptomeria japonica]